MSRDYRDVLTSGGDALTFGGDDLYVRRPVGETPLAALPDPWLVELRDVNGVKLHEVDAGEFSAVVRRNAPGQWRLRMPLDEFDGATGVVSVRVRDARRTIFAGWVSPLASAGGGITRIVTAEERSLVLEGVDAWWPLMTRLVFPDPATAAPWSQFADVRAGVASTVAAEFIAHNLGADALAERQADIGIIDPIVGGEGTWAGRLLPLAGLVGQVCTESGIVCVPSVDDAGRPVFRFRQVSDRSNALVLADDDDLASTTWTQVPPRATWVLAAGGGEGTTRAFVSRGSGVGLGRVEMLTEQSNAETTAQLALLAEAVRRDQSTVVSLDGTVMPSAATRLRFGIDYDVGDALGVQVGGDRVPSPVTAVRIEVSARRQQATPVLGTWSPDRLQGLRRDVLGLAERFQRNIS